MKKYYIPLVLILLIFNFNIFSQGISNPVPIITNLQGTPLTEFHLGCNGNGFEIQATFPDVGKTSNYEVKTITFGTFGAPRASEITAGTAGFITSLVSTDDQWASSDIFLSTDGSFDFTFFENAYNNMTIGTNGIVSFNTDTTFGVGNGYSGFCDWTLDVNDKIGSTGTDNLFRNSIFFPYHDIDISIPVFDSGVQVNEFYWRILGTPPDIANGIAGNRFVVIGVLDNAFYNAGICPGLRATHEVILYETTNIIEIHVAEKPICTAWNDGLAVMGIQNGTPTTAPDKGFPASFGSINRDMGVWAANDEGWQFTPNGSGGVTPTVQWFDENGVAIPGATNPVLDIDPLAIYPNASVFYTVEVYYTNELTGQVLKSVRSIEVFLDFDPTIGFIGGSIDEQTPNIGEVKLCTGDDYTLHFTTTGADPTTQDVQFEWTESGTVISTTDSFTITNAVNNTSTRYDVLVSLYNAAGGLECQVSDFVNVIVQNPSFTYTNNVYCNIDSDPQAANPNPPGGTFSINNGGVLIDASTGLIDISASGAGTDNTGDFVITYTAPLPSTCDVDVSIHINAPTINVTSAPACSTDLSTYSLALATNGGTLTSDFGTVTNPSGNTWNIDAVTAGQNIIVSLDLNGCTTDLNVTAPNCNCPSVTAPTGSNQSECEQNSIQTLTATATPPTGYTIRWYNVATGGTPITSTPTLNVVGTISYFAESFDSATNCTSSTRTEIVLEIKAQPTISFTTGTGAPICSADLSTYSLGVTVSAGNVISTAGTVTNTAGNLWTISNIPDGTAVVVTVDLAGCTTDLNVPAPDCSCPSIGTPTGSDQSECEQSPIQTLTATAVAPIPPNAPAGTVVRWYNTITGGAEIANPTWNTVGTKIYYAESYDAITNCTSTSRTPIELTIIGIPTASAQTETVCSNIALNLTLDDYLSNIPVPVGTTYTWVVNIDNPNVTGETFVGNTNTIIDTLINNSITTQDVVYRITPTSAAPDSCIGSPFNVTVTVDIKPTGTVQNVAACSDDVLNLDLSLYTNLVGNTYIWVATDNVNVTGESLVVETTDFITDELNNITTTDQIVTYSVTPTSANGCAGSPFDVNVTVHPEPSSPTQTAIVCSDDTLNLDLSLYTNLVGTTYSWVAADNAEVSGETTTLSATSLITDTLNNITDTDQIVVYTVIPTSALPDGCVGNSFLVEVTVQPEPVGIIQSLNVCSEDVLDLSLDNFMNNSLTGNTYSWVAQTNNPNVTGESLIAVNSISITDTLFNVSSPPTPQDVIYEVTPISSNNCAGDPFIVTVRVELIPLVSIPTTTFIECETVLGGLTAVFDTTGLDSEILGSQNPQGLEVVYLAEDGTQLPSPLPHLFTSISQEITAYVTNTLTINGCDSPLITFNLDVNLLPRFDLPIQAFICPTATIDTEISATNPQGSYTYEWFDVNDNPVDLSLVSGIDNETLTLNNPNQIGDYYVTATVATTDPSLFCTSEKWVSVSLAEQVVITNIFVNDFSGIDNSITIEVAGGTDDFTYILEDEDGSQTTQVNNPIFENVLSGIYTIQVIDNQGCSVDVVVTDLAVLDYPRFFTPNGDAFNNTWKIPNSNLISNATIYIFDRFGKVLAQIDPNSNEGWDGTYNGKQLPASDYWFTLDYLDPNTQLPKTVKGHFSIVRKGEI